jgi:hypothetical protein
MHLSESANLFRTLSEGAAWAYLGMVIANLLLLRTVKPGTVARESVLGAVVGATVYITQLVRLVH